MELTGIDGSNPLGFLAALGTLRLCDQIWPEAGVSMRWVRRGTWRAVLEGAAVADPEELCRVLAGSPVWAPLGAFSALGPNLTVAPEVFVKVAGTVVAGGDPRAMAFLAAFGCEVCVSEKEPRMEYTDLCFITGSGHQNFLETAERLSQQAGVAHLHEALFESWRYADEKCSFRWSPADAKEYALQWRNPSRDGSTTVWGANRLAFEALPLFPVVPAAGGRLRTTGFRRARGGHEFTWPLWTTAAGVDTVRSLVALEELHIPEPPVRELAERGIGQVFRVQRVRIGQGANFKVSFRPARAL